MEIVDAMRVINEFSSLEDLREGRIFLVDKKYGFTSFSAVNKLRWMIRHHAGIKKIKVGHAGTLDPLATGLLVICVGKMTKQIQHLIQEDKTYTGSFSLGQITPSFDLETEPSEMVDTAFVDEQLLHKTAQDFLGEQDQYPPVFSAKKIDGKRAYEMARKGEEVELKSSRIRIDHFDITRFDNPEVEFEIACSKGTYIRSIANDFGQQLGCGAYLKSLRRTQSGAFNIDQAESLQEIEQKLIEVFK